MRFRTVLMLAALATASVSCVVHTVEPGTTTSNGDVYLGFDLFDSKGKPDRERYVVGQQYGTFSSIFLTADKPVGISKVVVIFSDGERFAARVPKKLGGGRSSPAIGLPRGPRQIHSIVVDAKSEGKHLAKIEIYGTH